jgi:hypothetical protein
MNLDFNDQLPAPGELFCGEDISSPHKPPAPAGCAAEVASLRKARHLRLNRGAFLLGSSAQSRNSSPACGGNSYCLPTGLFANMITSCRFLRICHGPVAEASATCRIFGDKLGASPGLQTCLQVILSVDQPTIKQTLTIPLGRTDEP